MTTQVPGSTPGDVFHCHLSFAEARPTLADIEKVLGYPPGQASEPVVAASRELLHGTDDLWSIQGGYVAYSVIALDPSRHTVDIGGLTFDVGKVVAGQLAGAEAMAVFACTAGPGIEELSRRQLASGDPVTGLIADALGSLVVENAIDRVQSLLASAMETRGWRITARYSPGYCGWCVDEQKKLFRLLPPDFCGVNLTESALMHPIKSVSGFIGIGPRVTRWPYTCRLCELGDCLYRKLKAGTGPARKAPAV